MLKNALYITIFALVSWGSYQLSYPSNTSPSLIYNGVIFQNVINHIDKLTQGPRAVGDYYHDDVQRYLIKQLNEIGLTVRKQRTTSFNVHNRAAAPVRNIIAKYPGTNPKNKGLMLLAHYDAAKYAGKGASDDASGVAVILESINALVKSKVKPSNDIIILFTDAEELGLLGAHAFINEQLQNNNIGLIINLEARGSSGPNMMWPETTTGNRKMIEAFTAANVPMPVTTSLHYEIYKLLPNDTDLTPFNQKAEINGFNFAYIDNHFNYHTTLDSLERMSINTLAHQTIQMQHMLAHFATTDINEMQSENSLVYFSIPMLGLIAYPTAFTWILLVVFTMLFIGVLSGYLKQGKTSFKSILLGFIPLVIACVSTYFICWLILSIIYFFYPEYVDIMQGFPYQGHHIMTGLMLCSAGIAVTVFGFAKEKTQNSRSMAYIFVWLLLLFPSVYFFPGSGLLIWPVVMSISILTVQLFLPKLAEQLAPVLATISFLIIGTLLINFPIAMGIKAIPLTAIVLVLSLSLFLPIISSVKKLRHAILLITLPLIYLVAELTYQPSISEQNPLPTSLSYLYDVESQQGYYYHYDQVRAGWNEALFSNQLSGEAISQFRKKYRQPVKGIAMTEEPTILKPIVMSAKKPLKQNENQIIEVSISAHSNSRVLDIYTEQNLTVYNLGIEGRNAVLESPLQIRAGEKLLQYYFDGDKELTLVLEVGKNEVLNWQVQTHSLDLLKREEFGLEKRPIHLIKKAFIKSDNVVSTQSFAFGSD